MAKKGWEEFMGAIGTTFWAFRMFGPRSRRRPNPHGSGSQNGQGHPDDESTSVALGATWEVSAEFGRLAKRVFWTEGENGPDTDRSAKIAAILKRATAEIDAL